MLGCNQNKFKDKSEIKINSPQQQQQKRYILTMEQDNLITKPPPSFFDKLDNIFFFNGITALLGWNVVLGSLDYFNFVYAQYNVYLYFPIPVFIAYAITAVFFHSISLQFGYKFLTKIGIIGVNVAMIILLLFSIILKNNTQIGFWLSLVVCFFIGFFNNFCQLSFFAMINYFGLNVVSKFTIGTAASGFFVALLRVIITAIFGVDQTNIVPIIIYFSIALIFNCFDLGLNFKLFKSQQYIEQFEKVQSNITQGQTQSMVEARKFKNYARNLIQSYKQTTPFPLIIFFNFVLTFLLFPDLSFTKKTGLGSTWTPITMNLMYNLGDLGGKFIGDFRGSFNERSILFLFFSRLFFFYTIPLMDKQFTQDDILLNNNIFPFFNQFLFALTNGLTINGCFILSFQKASSPYKKFAGVFCGILLQFGIVAGTFLAIPFVEIVKPDRS